MNQVSEAAAEELRPRLQPTDLHWLAGLIEGEGCYRRYGKAALQITIGMTDRDVVERAARLMGGHVVRCEKRPPRKAIYRVAITGPAAAAWMMTLYSLMGQRRRARIREALTVWRCATRRYSVCGQGLHALSADNTYTQSNGARRCHECLKKYQRDYARRWRAERKAAA